MGVAADALRPYWLPGIHTVVGRPIGGIGEWLRRKNYQIYNPISLTQFTLNVSDLNYLATSIAADISRLASATFETIHSADEPSGTPRASAWFSIRTYYAAYYASNALSRILATSISQLESEQTREVLAVANAYGAAAVPAIQSGLYECVYNATTRELSCTKQSGAGGAHEQFWLCFLSLVRRIGNQILASPSASDRSFGVKLTELGDCLCAGGRNGGNWLSYVRNQITYRHAHGAWFPYSSGTRREVLRRVFLPMWRQDPMKIRLLAYPELSLERFVTISAFLVAVCWELLEDILNRSPERRSFLRDGPHAYLNHIARYSR